MTSDKYSGSGGPDSKQSSLGPLTRRSFVKAAATATAVGAFGVNPVSARSENIRVEGTCQTLRMENRGDESSEVTIEGPDGYTNTFELVSRERRNMHRLAPGEYTMTASGDTTVNGEDSQTFDLGSCDGDEIPDLVSGAECRDLEFGNGEENTTAQNLGARVHITGDNGYESLVDVPPMGEAELVGMRDGDYTVTATADDGSQATIDGDESKTVSFPAPCEHALEPFDRHIEVTADCGTISLENFASDAIDVTVTGPNGYENVVTVAGGETVNVTGLTKWYHYVVTAAFSDGGQANVNSMPKTVVRIPCEGNGGDGGGDGDGGDGGDGGSEEPEEVPDVEATSNECEKLTVTNTGKEKSVDVDIDGPSGYFGVTLNPGDSRTLSNLEEGNYSVSATATDGGDATVNGKDSDTVSVQGCGPLGGLL